MSQPIEIASGDRILISRTDRLGDLILALPFVSSLKKRYPDSRVDVLSSLYASPILEQNQDIDGIVRVQNDQLKASRPYRKELQQKIQKAGYRVVVVLYPERHISRLLYRVGIPVRIGTAGRFHSVFFTHRLLHSRKTNRKHEAAYNLDFLRYFADGPTDTEAHVYPSQKELDHADRLLAENRVESPFVALHPGSGGSAERWPMDRFLTLHDTLTQQGYHLVVTGSQEEGEAFGKLTASGGARVTSLAGQTDLRTLAAVLARSSVLVANSTGPLHLAVAVGTRVVGLYPSKRIMSPVRWGPLGEGHQVLQPDMAQCECPNGKCRCMETISVEEVAEAVDKVYRNVIPA